MRKLGLVGVWSLVGAVASATAGGFGGALAKKYRLDLEGQISNYPTFFFFFFLTSYVLLPLMDISWILPGVALGVILKVSF